MTASRRPRTVLFLIADTGAGHRSAANAITEAMQAVRAAQRPAGATAASSRTRDPGWRSLVVDVFAECGRFPLRNGVFLYGPTIKHSPQLYGQIYRLTNTSERFNAARRLCQPFLRQGLRELLERTRPDVIVSIHPLLNHVTLQVLRDLGLRIPFLTVVTDLVSIHCAWVAPGADACVVPTDEARAFAIAEGMAPRRVHLLGMPISPRFSRAPEASREARRAALGLAPSLPVVLLVGGGEGAGGLAEAVETLSGEQLPAQLVVIAGRNAHLRAEIDRLRPTFAMPIQVCGFVQNMPDYLWAADVIVTKAGPGTICEALACELPIVLTGAVPGQEEGNVDFVLDNGVGTLATTPEELTGVLRELLDPINPRLATLRENVRRIRQPEASFDIARLILSYLPARTAPSVWDTRHRAPRGRVRRVITRSRRVLPRITRGPVRSITSMREPGTHTVAALRALRVPHASARSYMPGLARLSRMSALLRGEGSEKIQLRRPGSRRRRHDARTPLGSGRG